MEKPIPLEVAVDVIMSTKIPYVIFTFISMWSYNKNVLIYYYNGLDAHDCKWCTTICYSSWSSLGSSHFDHLLYHTINTGMGQGLGMSRNKAMVESFSIIWLRIHIHPCKQWAIPHWVTSLLWNQSSESMYQWSPTRPSHIISWPRTCSFWQEQNGGKWFITDFLLTSVTVPSCLAR